MMLHKNMKKRRKIVCAIALFHGYDWLVLEKSKNN